MSQQMTPDADDSAEQTDDRSMADMAVEEIETATEIVSSLTEADMASMSDEDLVAVRTALKDLEDESEEARSDRADEELSDRVEPGDRLHGLKRVVNHNKYVAEDAGSVIMRAVSNGVDYTDFVDLDASALAESDLDVEIGEYEYTYFL